MEIERFFTCPSCRQQISFVLDLPVEEQSYIEDCEVCRRPIRIFYRSENHELIDFQAESTEQ